jgi:hypothetical protein
VPREALAILHDIPGRLRVRLPATARIADLEGAVSQLPGVVSSRWSPRTRSLLTTYRPEDIEAETILGAIADQAGVDPAPEPDTAATRRNGSPVAAALVQTVTGMDRRLGHASGGVFTLGVLVPLALALWAMRDLTRGPIRALPWSTALWYAHGLFRDYNIHGRD